MKLRDFKGLFTTTKVSFIRSENIANDYYEIRLEKPKNLTWRPGEHGIFKLPGKKVENKKWRAFSIASSPKEDIILLGTRAGEKISSFKQQLITMKHGETVQIRGPFGWFVSKSSENPIVLIALGVGITPIRALLVQLEHRHQLEVDVVYSSNDYYMFKERIDTVISQNKSFNIDYVSTKEDTEISILKQVKKYGNSANYYISGSMKGIKSIKRLLKEKGIKSSRIINDPFLGY
jgi:ferredoxin-NADP reductase